VNNLPKVVSCIIWQSYLAACGHVLFVTRRAARACVHIAAIVS